MSIRQGRSTESRFAGTLRGRPIADWLELMAKTDDAWIYARKGLGNTQAIRKPVVRVYDPTERTDNASAFVDRMMAASARLTR